MVALKCKADKITQKQGLSKALFLNLLHNLPCCELMQKYANPFNKLMSVFYVSVLLLIMNFVITLSK